MMWQTILVVAGTAAAVLAQDTTTTTSSSDITPASTTSASSTSNQPVTHTIGVAQGGFTFSPDVTLANVGDTIEFDFYPTNHSVIRAAYGYPCIPYEDTGVDRIGFYSGFHPVDAILDDPPKFSVTVNDTDPIFFYCGATGSCISHQMVGVVNPNATTSLTTQKQLAGESTFMLLPGQPWPSEGDNPIGPTSVDNGPTAAPNPTSTSSPTTTTAESSSKNKSSSISPGAIAGICIGAAVVVLAAASLLYMCGLNSKRRQAFPMHPGHVSFVPPTSGHVSYIDPSKHMSMHSNYLSSALPGYLPRHQPTSPPLQVTYPTSEALNPGFDASIPESPTPSHSHTLAAPAYGSGNAGNIISTYSPTSSEQSGIYSTPTGVHEMAAPETSLNRRSSISKTGGVERYG